MANHVGSAYVSIMPSMDGFAGKTANLFNSNGSACGTSFSSGFNKGMDGLSAAQAKFNTFGAKVSSIAGAVAGTGFVSSVTSKLSGLGSSISGKASSALSGVRGVFSSGGSSSGTGFVSSVTSKLSGLGSSISGKASSALSSIKGLFGSTGSTAGSDMGSRLASAFSAKAGAIAGVASAISQSVLSTITSSIESAVSRVDTLSNYPTVLTNLGYSIEDASASTQTLSDRLGSLPTRLDAAASGVQQLAPASESVQQATDRYLAFNDALLAGAASENIQQNAMEQLTKSLNTGKMEMDSWQSIQAAMPGQLQQVAQSMLGESASASDLYNAMSNGTVSVQDFADAMVDLDQNGAEGITSFAKQAETAVGGIGTSLANAKNAVTKGIASVIQAIGSDNIVGVINTVKGGINAAFGGIVSLVEPAKQAFSDLGGSMASLDADSGVFTAFMSQAAALLPTVSSAISMVVGGALAVLPGVLASVAPLATAIMGLMQAAIPVIAQIVADVVDFAAQLIAAVAPALTSIVTTITAFLPVIQAIWSAVWPVMSAVVATVFDAISLVVQTVMSVVQAVIATVMAAINGDWDGVWNGIQAILSAVWNGMCGIVSALIGTIQGAISGALGTIQGIWSGAWSAVQSVLNGAWNGIANGVSNGISSMVGFVSSIPGRILGALGDVGSILYNAGTSIINGFINGMKSAIDGAYSFASGIAGTIASLKGPITYDRKVLIPNGIALMQSLGTGLEKGFGNVADYVSGVASKLSATLTVDAGSRSYEGDSVNLPASPITLAPVDIDVADGEASSTAVIQWLERNLPGIISESSPDLVIDNDAGKLIVDNRLYQLQRKAAMNRG